MPEFELDEESVSRAEKLSSRLMNDLREVSERGPRSEVQRELFSERRYSEQSEGVPISDVVANVSLMAREFAMARRWDGEIPCLKLDDGGIVPISLTEFFAGPTSLSYGSLDWVEFWEYIGGPLPHRFMREFFKRSGQQEEEIVVSDVRGAEEGTQSLLNGFLSYRFAGMKRWAEWIQGIGTHGLACIIHEA